MSSFRSGFIAILGRPNVGKSTLLNRLLGSKVAIVSPRPQTTRNRILGVLTRPSCQMVFLDTPGIHAEGGALLNRAMVKTAFAACQEVDAILYLVEAAQGVTERDLEILGQLPRGQAPLYVLFNKVDQTHPDQLLLKLAAWSQAGIAYAEALPISALTGEKVAHLLEVLAAAMPEGPQYFPDDQVTDQPERQLVGEIVREKLFLNLHQELPYAVAVRVDEFREWQETLQVDATIWVTRESQKPIVIGKGGALLKRIGSAARRDLERLLGTHVFLRLWVKVRKDWNDDPRLLRELGYADGSEDAGA